MKQSNKKKKGNKQNLVVQNLIVRTPQRKLWDVGTWRSALRSADRGRVRLLYDLFDDIMLDGILSDAVQKRIDAVTNSELTFQNSKGEEVEEITHLMDTISWEDLLTEIVKSKIYGRSAIELNFSDGFEVFPVHPKHIDLTRKQILLDPSDDKGIPFEKDNMLLVLGRERDFGLLLKATPYAIYKRGGFGDWSQWIELFGMPQRIGKYNTFDPQSRKLLEEAFQQAGSAPWMVVPKETDIETKESNSGNGTSFNEFRQACNEEILITVLGQTMTTIQGEKGARALGEVHKVVEEGKNRADIRYTERVLNQKLLPMLQQRGFPVEGGRFIFPQAAEQLSVEEVCRLAGIIKIPASYIYDKYAIPTPKNDEELAKPQGLPTYPGIDFEQYQEDNNELEEEIKNSDQTFLNRLKRFFVSAPRMSGATHGNLHINLSEAKNFNERLALKVANGTAKKWDEELFKMLSEDFLKALQTGYKRGIKNADRSHTYNVKSDAYITAMEMNLFQFSAGKTLAEIQELNKAFRESKSFNEFNKKAESICDTFNRKWQETEYVTATLTAEAATTYYNLKEDKEIYPYWTYVTAGDEHVREEHAKLNGLTLPENDPRWDEIYPPNGWRCRCRVKGTMRYEVHKETVSQSRKIADEYMESSEWKSLKVQGWAINRCKTAEVFNSNQQYIRKFPQKAAAYLGELYHTDYGLEDIEKRMKQAVQNTPLYQGTAQEWYKGKNVLTDYKGRSIQLTRDVFKKHTTNKYEKVRVPLLAAMEETLKNPDEVWINDFIKNFDNYNFIKFYKDKVICVIGEIEKGRMYKINTWFEIEIHPKNKARIKKQRKNNPRWKFRRGLLIKK